MVEIGTRELRNRTREVLDRAAAGEDVVITVHGRPSARLVPLASRPSSLPRELFLEGLETGQADPGLSDDLRELAPDTTDDLAW